MFQSKCRVLLPLLCLLSLTNCGGKPVVALVRPSPPIDLRGCGDPPQILEKMNDTELARWMLDVRAWGLLCQSKLGLLWEWSNSTAKAEKP